MGFVAKQSSDVGTGQRFLCRHCDGAPCAPAEIKAIAAAVTAPDTPGEVAIPARRVS
jgi:hypothetical protein